MFECTSNQSGVLSFLLQIAFYFRDDNYQQYDMQYGGGRGGGPGHMPMGGNGGPGHHPGWGHGAAHDMGGGMPPHQEFPMSGGPNR